MGRIIAFTGTHGVGKTWSTKAMADQIRTERPKTSVGVITDVERACPYPINQDATERAQQWIFYHQIAKEIDMVATWDLVVSDRTVLDVIAYTRAAGFKVLADQMLYMARGHLSIYRHIYFLTAKNHPYHVRDGIRDMCPDFRIRVESILKDLYRVIGMEITEV